MMARTLPMFKKINSTIVGGCSSTLRQINMVPVGKQTIFTSRSAAKLTPQATQQKIIGPMSSSMYCKRKKAIQYS